MSMILLPGRLWQRILWFVDCAQRGTLHRLIVELKCRSAKVDTARKLIRWKGMMIPPWEDPRGSSRLRNRLDMGRSIVQLSLSLTQGLVEADIVALAENIQRAYLPQLLDLRLRNINLTDEGAVAICDGLKVHKKLLYLDVSENIETICYHGAIQLCGLYYSSDFMYLLPRHYCCPPRC